MIKWVEQLYRNHAVGRLLGECDATTYEELLTSVQELWATFLSMQLPRYDPTRWNSIIGFVQVSHGNIDIRPTLSLDLTTQLLGCALYLKSFHKQYESIETEHEREAMHIDMERMWIRAILPAFELARSNLTASSVLHLKTIPLRVLTEPDGPPAFTTSLRG